MSKTYLASCKIWATNSKNSQSYSDLKFAYFQVKKFGKSMVFLTPFWISFIIGFYWIHKEIWNHLAQTSNHYNFWFTEPILIIFFSKNSYEFSASRRLLKSTILELSFLTLICLNNMIEFSGARPDIQGFATKPIKIWTPFWT